MPIFTRRRLQAMLTDLRPYLDEGKERDLIRRLEARRVDQTLPAEMELALLWGLSQLGDFEIEPEWLGTDRRPDAYSEALFDHRQAVVEIAALSDGGMSGEEDMRRVASRICEAANRIKRGAGKCLYLNFLDESGYLEGRYFRRRKVNPNFEVTEAVASSLTRWLTSEELVEGASLRVSAEGTDVVLQWKSQPQLNTNFFSSMPPETYSLTDNPLYSVLDAKAKQLKHGNTESVRCLLLADAGSTLLRRLDERDNLSRRVNGRQIIEHFLQRNSESLHAVCVFSPLRQGSLFFGLPEPMLWRVTALFSPSISLNTSGLEKLASTLPRPRFEGYQARSLQQQDLFTPSARGWYIGTKIESKRQSMTISISARALLDLLAGRITRTQFLSFIGMEDESSVPNQFKLRLDRGEVMSSVQLETGGLDEDDDRLVFEFNPDASASCLLPQPNGDTTS